MGRLFSVHCIAEGEKKRAGYPEVHCIVEVEKKCAGCCQVHHITKGEKKRAGFHEVHGIVEGKKKSVQVVIKFIKCWKARGNGHDVVKIILRGRQERMGRSF